MADDWRSWPRRQRIIHQIDEYLRQNPEGSAKTAQELESSIFQKATKEEEYLQYVSKIFKYFKDLSQNTNPNNSNLTAMLGGQQGNLIRPSMGQGGPNTMPQMGHPGSVGTSMAHPTSVSGGSMGHSMGGNQGISSSGMMQGQMVGGPNRMQQPIMGGGMNTQHDMMNWQGKGRRSNEMGAINVNAKHSNISSLNQVNAQSANKMATMQMPLAGQPEQVNMMNMGNQISRHGMMQHRAPSPSFSMAGGTMPLQRAVTPSNPSPIMQQQSQPQHNMQPSMNFVSPSPSSNPVPSPVSNAGGGRSVNQLGASSPGSVMVNTPGQPHSNNASIEDRAYTEKVKQLQSKYLDTLREVAQRFENSDSENARKIRNLLEVIENPHRRATKGMETLKACESVLERLGIQQREARGEGTTPKPHGKENPVAVLFDAINMALKSPLGPHTIHRTLSPALRTLLGPDLDLNLPSSFKIEDDMCNGTESPLISEIVQGEVARLLPRFKVNLESQLVDDIILSCQLDDPNLPCVPPISLIIPTSYPNAPPRCTLPAVDYDTTDFLKKVKQIMTEKLFHLPEVCSLTMLLEGWEMSVRRACSPKTFVPDAIDPLTNLNFFA